MATESSSKSLAAEKTQSTSSERPPEGVPCWIEIPAVDVEACKKFYTSLFPSWEFTPANDEYNADDIAMYTFSKPEGFGGGIIKVPTECKKTGQPMGAGMTVYYFVKSIEEIQARIHDLGGTTCLEKTPQADNGWFANFKDVEGNRFGCFQVKEK